MKISLLTVKIAQAMGYDKKDIFQRLSKLLEEQGELLEAFMLSDFNETIEEAVDNLLVVTSIAFVINPDAIKMADDVVNNAFLGFPVDPSISQQLLMEYIVSTGQMSDAIQKNRKVAASSYKGQVSDEEAITFIFKSLTILSRFLASQTNDVQKINALVLKKNTKWLEKSLLGMGLTPKEIELANETFTAVNA